MDKWYANRAEFLARYVEAGKNITEMSKQTGVTRTTLSEWKTRHAIKEDEGSNATATLLLENQRLRKHAAASASGDLASERVIERIEAAVASQRPSWEATEVVVPAGGKTAQELVLMYSDLHAAEVVTLEATRGINEYNWTVMEERMAKIQLAVLSHAQHFGFPISKLHIHMLGDMLSGDIHEELAITNDRPLAEAVVDLAYAHTPWILRFAEEFPVRIAGVPGNHPRPRPKTSFKEQHNNADWLFYKMLEALLKGHPNIEFDLGRGGYSVQMICDRWRTLLMHGDGIRTTMPGVPWGGVIRRITTLEAQFNAARQPLDYVEMGHFHTSNSLDGIHAKTFTNGSVKGADEYGLAQFGSGRDAEQKLLAFHPKRGYTGEFPLNLQDTRPGSEGW